MSTAEKPSGISLSNSNQSPPGEFAFPPNFTMPDHTQLPPGDFALPPGFTMPDHTQLPDHDGTFVQNFQELPQSLILSDSIEPILQRRHPDGQ